MDGSVSIDQSDLVAALIISLHFLLAMLDIIIGGIILMIYRQKNSVKFINKLFFL
jgi:hypothetical protein